MNPQDFRALQAIYEDYRGQDREIPDNLKYMPRTDLKNSYIGGPGKTPGAQNPIMSSTIPSEGEEEVETILSKIQELISKAEEDGQTYTKSILFDLLTFIKKSH
jgi:hypothetical protein